MKYLTVFAIAAALIGAAIVTPWSVAAQIPENGDVCYNIPGIQLVPPANFHTIVVRYAEEPKLRSECVRNEATPTPTPVATPVATPTNTVTIACEGQYLADAPYARFMFPGYGLSVNPLVYNPALSFGNFANLANLTGLGYVPYAPGYSWPSPTLVVRANGAVTWADPYNVNCMPVAPAATPTVAPPQIVVVQAAAPAPAAPVAAVTQPATAPRIFAPNTGSAGLAAE